MSPTAPRSCRCATTLVPLNTGHTCAHCLFS
uniref:Uncharacterized protein n=1 Tax=Anguilla anguilla TaxID=7936 RepID=A0A0E9SJ75_ANGAN